MAALALAGIWRLVLLDMVDAFLSVCLSVWGGGGERGVVCFLEVVDTGTCYMMIKARMEDEDDELKENGYIPPPPYIGNRNCPMSSSVGCWRWHVPLPRTLTTLTSDSKAKEGKKGKNRKVSGTKERWVGGRGERARENLLY